MITGFRRGVQLINLAPKIVHVIVLLKFLGAMSLPHTKVLEKGSKHKTLHHRLSKNIRIISLFRYSCPLIHENRLINLTVLCH